MTSTSWTNQAYYGLKLKKDFTLCDTLTKKYRDRDLDDLEIDTMLKIMKHKATLAINVSKIMSEMDTANRLQNMEAIINAVTPEALLEAKKIIGT